MYQLPFTAIAVIILVAMLIALTINFMDLAIKTSVVDKTATEDLETIHISRMVKDCFIGSGNYITKDFLISTSGKNICDLCQICDPETHVLVKDINTADEWSYDYTGDADNQHVIFVNLYDNTEIHVGRLYVET